MRPFCRELVQLNINHRFFFFLLTRRDFQGPIPRCEADYLVLWELDTPIAWPAIRTWVRIEAEALSTPPGQPRWLH